MPQLKITLVDSEPEVWRQIWVPADLTLSALHGVIQKAMGWENLHDYRFALSIGHIPLNTEMQVGAAIAQANTLYYTYDFQSGWLHRISVETPDAEAPDAEAPDVEAPDAATPHAESAQAPVCIGGAAACPPEGAGGVWGYDELLARLEDTDDPDYLELIEKYSSFDPERFDLEAANARLKIVSEQSN